MNAIRVITFLGLFAVPVHAAPTPCTEHSFQVAAATAAAVFVGTVAADDLSGLPISVIFDVQKWLKGDLQRDRIKVVLPGRGTGGRNVPPLVKEVTYTVAVKHRTAGVADDGIVLAGPLGIAIDDSGHLAQALARRPPPPPRITPAEEKRILRFLEELHLGQGRRERAVRALRGLPQTSLRRLPFLATPGRPLRGGQPDDGGVTPLAAGQTADSIPQQTEASVVEDVLEERTSIRRSVPRSGSGLRDDQALEQWRALAAQCPDLFSPPPMR